MSVRANIETLTWDSEFFAMPIARLSAINEPNSPLLIGDELNNYQLVQAKISANDYIALTALQQLGFQIVDGEIDLEINLALDVGSDCLGLATKTDIPQLKQLASGAFQSSRFRSPWFTELDNQRIYSVWTEKAVLGTYDDYCLVIRGDQHVIKGFVTLRQLSTTDMRVGLLMVNPAYRQQGIGEALINGVITWCQARQTQRLFVATQTGNIPALRLYIKCGATIASSSYWLYRTTK